MEVERMSTKNVILGGSAIIAILLVGALMVTATVMQFGISKEEAVSIAATAAQGTVLEVELENENSVPVYEVDIAKDGKQFEVSVDAETGEVKSVEEEEVDVPITGSALDRASAAALSYIGEGKVTDTEIGDEEGYYEIEITVDGREVDVHLDEDFNVLSTEWD
jgi:uncharacterized membrane protein YkoI